MIHSAFVFFVVVLFSIGVVEEVVVPTANKVIDVATPVVEKAIDYVMPSTPTE
jgi:hypothetical protein|tara:strand:- start:27 stop:185 length:159 start_codon:yes stop_codon:yes gene_type:complete